MEVWAHSRNDAGVRQSLREHLVNTATLAKEFASAFGAAEAGWAVGLLHDVGKVSPEWQYRLKCLEAGLPAKSVDHKGLGSRHCGQHGFIHGALVVAGHHGGIPDTGQQPDGDAADDAWQAVRLAIPEVDRLPDLSSLLPPEWTANLALAEFGIRLLHSCLVDADYLDTAAHFAGDPVPRADAPADPAELLQSLLAGRSRYLAGRPPAPVDVHRESVFDACLGRATDPPGVYRLSAPTGSGKTIASAAFALRHAASHGLRRVVVAVPFTTITEQNASVYRSLLGEDVVLEHHSAVEPEQLAGRGVENWDAPFVVTTTVQLFESLFSNRPSKTRKLHRLANSVIVLDEVQAIPDRLLVPILDGLKVLVDHFGVTVLMASATQPTWESLKPWCDAGLVPDEIVADRQTLFASLRRVRYEWLPPVSVESLAELALGVEASLTVVNTTGNSRVLAKLWQERTVSGSVHHLSTRMCRAHRADVLEQVRASLAAGEPVHLVSTQLIEAGVDLDFPLVLRQEAPAASLIQAGGRANREGRAELGRMVVFAAEGLATIQDYSTGLSLTRECFGEDPNRLEDPEAISDYFRRLYAVSRTNDLATAIQSSRANLAFDQVAKQFQMIEDDSCTVVVDWRGEVHQHVLDSLTPRMREGRGVVPRAVLRRLQPFVVALPSRLVSRPEVAALIDEPVPGIRLWRGSYDSLTGVGEQEVLSYVF